MAPFQSIRTASLAKLQSCFSCWPHLPYRFYMANNHTQWCWEHISSPGSGLMKNKADLLQISPVTSGIWRFITFLPECFVSVCLNKAESDTEMFSFRLEMWIWNSFQTDEAKIRRHKTFSDFMGLIFLLIFWTHGLTQEMEQDTRVKQCRTVPCFLLSTCHYTLVVWNCKIWNRNYLN